MKTIWMNFLLLTIFISAQANTSSINNTSPLTTYCASNGNSQYWEYIDYVAIGSISRTSGAENGGYYDGSAKSTDVMAGSTYSLVYSHANPWGGYVEDWAVYIDWNADGDFSDTGETALKSIAYTAANYTYQLTIPSTATLGATRMRVGMRFGNYPPPCGSFYQGEVEDYTLNIIGGTVCSETFEPNNTKGAAKQIIVNTGISSQISLATDIDWYSFSNTVASPNVKVELTNLPANYDVQLYDPSGVKVMTSKNSGTVNETIIYNSTLIGKYKIKVYGKNGVFNNSQCYLLQAKCSDVPYRLSEGAGLVGIHEHNLYPNPVASELIIQFTSDKEASVTIEVMSELGVRVYSRSEISAEGISIKNVDVSKLPVGIYYLLLISGEDRMVEKFIVTR